MAAAEEERFSRKKHDDGFPVRAIEYCLAAGGLTPDDIDYAAFYDKPLLKFERLLETYLAYAPIGFRSFLDVLPGWLNHRLRVPHELKRTLGSAFRRRMFFAEHHESHAASAFYPSPFGEAAILTFDGVGEWATASIGVGRDHQIELTHELKFPHSLGMLYSAFTAFCGFEVNAGEYKLMGLAPYGQANHTDLILDKLLDLKPDGSFRLDMHYFDYCTGRSMFSAAFAELFGGPPRQPNGPLTQREMDLAASIQAVTEEILLRAARHAHQVTGQRNLCLSGGVALNSVANGRLLREGPFDNLWIQPAAGDSGAALGVALLIWHELLGNTRHVGSTDSQRGSLLGPSYSDNYCQQFLEAQNIAHTLFETDQQLCEETAKLLDHGAVVGWFQGRMEFGPRALGARSILADARRPEMQATLNEKVKRRESFRPFAPAILEERVADYFELPSGYASPYMLLVTNVQESQRIQASSTGIAQTLDTAAGGSSIPSATHVDHSARVQTVDQLRHGRFHQLLQQFERLTGCPVLLNTSFNVRDEPIVCTPADAVRCFESTEIDALVLGRCLIRKSIRTAKD